MNVKRLIAERCEIRRELAQSYAELPRDFWPLVELSAWRSEWKLAVSLVGFAEETGADPKEVLAQLAEPTEEPPVVLGDFQDYCSQRGLASESVAVSARTVRSLLGETDLLEMFLGVDVLMECKRLHPRSPEDDRARVDCVRQRLAAKGARPQK
jgi:hypothetical protein